VALSAQKPKNDKGKGKSQGAPATHVTPATHLKVAFNDTQRGAVRSYFVNTHGRGNCPPGLAKKNNGCLPPGQAKKRYAVGQPLPSTVTIADLPRDLATRIGPVPSGYRYGMVDGDMIILAIPTRVVVDFIEGYIR